jgi:nitric oxide reductase NorD protein
VEDSRRAIFEARSAGLYPFCLTIDTSDPDPYLARIFGVSGYTILRRPEQLPVALLDLVRQLLRGGGAGR